MVYRFLKITMNIATRIFFKRIHFSGMENIPRDKPIIFASNHANAFMDAIVPAVFIKPEVYFLTRSDVFNTPLKSKILRGMNLLPIYRLQEGAENLHKNEEAFGDCYKVLARKKSLIIYSEGNCIQEKRLRKLKKGTARIAFGAANFNQHKNDLLIIPTGINYNKPSQFRSDIHIRFAKPIQVAAYREMYESDINKATITLTRDLEKLMSEQIVNIHEKMNDAFVDEVTELYKSQLIQHLNFDAKNSEHDFFVIRNIGEGINTLTQQDEEKAHGLRRMSHDYFAILHKLKLKNKTIVAHKSISFAKIILKSLLAITLFPIHIIALVLNYIPYKLPVLIAKKTCKHIEFVASVVIGTGAFLFLINFIFWGILFACIAHGLVSKFLHLFIAPLLGLFALHFYSWIKNLVLEIRFHQLNRKNKNLAEQLIHMRAGIIEALDNSILPIIKNNLKQ